MTLWNLKSMIDHAINDCQWVIEQNPKAILSEGDFERLLSDCISKRIGYCIASPKPTEFAVFSQVSHYNNEKSEVNARVDILLAKPADIEPCWDLNKKFKIYNPAESFAIELKYRHDNNRGCVTAAKNDIKKFSQYKDDSYYYSIILLDKNENTGRHKNEILQYFRKKKTELGRDYEKKFFCKVLVKETEE